MAAIGRCSVLTHNTDHIQGPACVDWRERGVPERAGREGDSQPLPKVLGTCDLSSPAHRDFIQGGYHHNPHQKSSACFNWREMATDVQQAVIADINARRELGIKRYGQALQPNNGRDGLQDAYEEAIDLCMYLKQVLLERSML